MIASITSCTNTSNPYVMIGAGLVARKARALGLTRKPWVKTSLAPGSPGRRRISEGRGPAGGPRRHRLQPRRLRLHHLHRQLRPARQPAISKAINDNDLVATAVLSGNRNFEGRISPDVRANYLASPPLVVAYALAGDMNIDLTTDPLGTDKDGQHGLSQGHLADEQGDRRPGRRDRHARGVPDEVRRRLQGRREVAGGGDHRQRDLRLAADLDLHPEPALLPGHVEDARRDHEHRRTRASSRCWAT